MKQNGTVASSGKILCLSVFAAQVFEDFLFSCVRVCLFVFVCVGFEFQIVNFFGD